VRPASWHDRLIALLNRFATREWEVKERDLKGALAEIDQSENPDVFRALYEEYWKHQARRPGKKKTN